MIRVYLAGSYSCPDKVSWRKEFKQKIVNKGIKFLDPHDRPKDMNANDIFSRDMWAIKNCDVLVTYSNKTTLGIGTSQEIVYAKYLGKTVIIIAPKESILRKDEHNIHPFLQKCCDHILYNIDEAIEKVQKSSNKHIKQTIDEAIDYFQKTMLEKDPNAKDFLSG